MQPPQDNRGVGENSLAEIFPLWVFFQILPWLISVPDSAFPHSQFR